MIFNLDKMAAVSDCVPYGIHCSSIFCFIIFLFKFIYCEDDGEVQVDMDLLLPYRKSHGPQHHSHRHIRDIHQTFKFGTSPHEIFPAHETSFVQLPIVHSRAFVENVGYYWDQRSVYGHLYIINNPEKTLSVLEPGGRGGCEEKKRSTVKATAAVARCIVATNAGFFNTTDGSCEGDIVSDGAKVLHTGKQNVHFGIRKDGSLFFGYLPESIDIAAEFSQLITGVIWLVRNGQSFVTESIQLEASDTQETGSLQYFVDVHSARLAIGCDAEGRVIIAQIDGHTGERGLSLVEFAELLIQWGMVHAVNMDGGGSVTAVVNGTLVSYPGDRCTDNCTQPVNYNCEREVSTILCVHKPVCDPANCSNHGDCINGVCVCHGNWEGVACDSLQCGTTNCSQHGTCTEGGCNCDRGWWTQECLEPCPPGKFGFLCMETCRCLNGAICGHIDGSCTCPPGYTGDFCEQVCPSGFYGVGCHQLCFCDNSCYCHHVTGACDVTKHKIPNWEVAECLIDQMIRENNLVPDQAHQLRLAVLMLICLVIIAAGSLILNITLICLRYRCRCTIRQPSSPQAKHIYRSFQPSSESSPPESSSSDTEEKELAITNEDMDIKLKEFQYKISKDELNRKQSFTMNNTSNL